MRIFFLPRSVTRLVRIRHWKPQQTPKFEAHNETRQSSSVETCPKYAILLHSWEEEEVSFKDMVHGDFGNKHGYEKIKMTCRLAAESGIRFARVSTCCIDKSGSVGLTKAINAMAPLYLCGPTPLFRGLGSS